MYVCTACRMKFGGLTAFDAHRIGKHSLSEGPLRRRCRTEDEMIQLGYALKKGVWKMPMNKDLIERLQQ